jgi:hypothetical protein
MKCIVDKVANSIYYGICASVLERLASMTITSRGRAATVKRHRPWPAADKAANVKVLHRDADIQ